MRIPRLHLLGVVTALVVASSATAQVPARLADSTFWRLMNEYSEPWGTFRSENFVSNETSLQYVIPQLTKRIAPGGVYLGVAPDQNFTYIAAVRPSIAFIVDIRHQNAKDAETPRRARGEEKTGRRHDASFDADPKAYLLGVWMERSGAPAPESRPGEQSSACST